MDFTHRSTMGASSAHNHPAAPQPAAPAPTPGAAPIGNGRGRSNNTSTFVFPNSRWMRVALVTLLFSLTIVAVGIVGLFYIGSSKEYKYVDTKAYQAVFLNNNQVYFGHIKTLNNKYVELQNIYYLNNQNTQGSTSTTNTSSNLSLVKLGCEVHGPTDEMIINSDQVAFWENLRNNGQVVTAIGTWLKDNPNGQTCSTTTNSTSQASGSGSSSATGGNTGAGSTGTSGSSSSSSSGKQ